MVYIYINEDSLTAVYGYDISIPCGNVNGHITITTILVQIAWYYFVTWCLTSAEQKVLETLVLVTDVYVVEERGSPLGPLRVPNKALQKQLQSLTTFRPSERRQEDPELRSLPNHLE